MCMYVCEKLCSQLQRHIVLFLLFSTSSCCYCLWHFYSHFRFRYPSFFWSVPTPPPLYDSLLWQQKLHSLHKSFKQLTRHKRVSVKKNSSSTYLTLEFNLVPIPSSVRQCKVVSHGSPDCRGNTTWWKYPFLLVVQVTCSISNLTSSSSRT